MAIVVLRPSRIGLTLNTRATTSPHNDPWVLVVETGNGVRGANSYATVDYAKSYFIGRRLYSSAWTTAERDVQAVALKQASLWLDAEFAWSGRIPLALGQGMAWPFLDATDRYGKPVVGVPKQVRDATCELAMYLLTEDRFKAREGIGLKSLRVDVISLVFDKEDVPEIFPAYVGRMLVGLGVPVRGIGTIRTVRLQRV